MYRQNQPASDVIAFQERVIAEQESLIAALKAALVAAGRAIPPGCDPQPANEHEPLPLFPDLAEDPRVQAPRRRA